MMKHFHFSGICGTAMASLAILLKTRGHKVTGSDENVYPPMSDLLEENQIPILQGYDQKHLQPHPDYVVLGNALSRGNPEVEYALEAKLHYLSMAEVLKNEFIRGNTSVVITGTHGKTTTTSIAAHIFTQCGLPTGFMIGGVPGNFSVSARDVNKGGYFVIEGDEYDTSLFDKRSKFFHYLPDRLIINNVEFDHADIFNNIGEIKRAFSLMLRQIPKKGLILVNGDDANAMEVVESAFSQVITFGLSEHNDAQIHKIKVIKGSLGMNFCITYQEKEYAFQIPLLGEFNVRNASAVILLALYEGIEVHKIQKALLSFVNTKRRLQQKNRNNKVYVFDDFAHHPTAIRENVTALRASWPDARIHAIYEARSNTSIGNYHQDVMADAFVQANDVTFFKLHRAERLEVGNRLDLEKIVLQLQSQGKKAQILETLDNIVDYTVAQAKLSDIIIVMSQGAFGGIAGKIATQLDTKWNKDK